MADSELKDADAFARLLGKAGLQAPTPSGGGAPVIAPAPATAPRQGDIAGQVAAMTAPTVSSPFSLPRGPAPPVPPVAAPTNLGGSNVDLSGMSAPGALQLKGPPVNVNNIDTSGMNQPGAAPGGVPAQAAGGAAPSVGIPQPAAYTIPAHFDNRNIPIRSETLRQEKNLQVDVLSDEQRLVKAQSDAAAIQANELGHQAETAQTQLAERQGRELDRRASLQDMRAKAQGLVDNVAKQRIDPNAAFNNGDLGSRLNLIVGGALGGVFQSRAHLGSNPFIDQVNKTIDRNIAAQRDNLSNAKDSAGLQMNMLGHLQSELGDERLADNVFAQQQMQVVQNIIEAQTAKRNLPSVQAQGSLALDAVKQKQLDLQKQYDSMAYVKAQTVQPKTATGVDAEKPDDLFVPTGGADRSGNPVGFRARTTDEAKEARIIHDARQQAAPIIERLKSLRAKTSMAERGAGKLGIQTGDLAEIDALQNQLTTIVKPLEQVKSLNDNLQQSSKELAGDWARVGGAPERAGDSFLRGLDNRFDAIEKGQAGQGATSALGVDGKGNIVQHSLGGATQAVSTPQMRQKDGRAYVARDTVQKGVKNLEDFRKKLGAK